MKSTTPIVSVVVPMYNVEKYIEGCLESVLNQTFPHFEIICVDDGCTDKTLELVNQYSDPRIIVVRQENKGLAAARNTGINMSRGIYVALLDSDDYWHEKKLEVHVRHLCSRPEVGVSYSPSLFVDDDGNSLGIGQYPKLENITIRDVMCRNPVGNGSAAVIRRSTLNEIGELDLDHHRFNFNYFDPLFRQSEDLECWLRIALNTRWKFEGVKEALTYYRVNTNGLSANVEKQHESWKRVMNKNLKNHKKYYDKWYSLAEAYQERYLARRLIQSGESLKAIKMVNQAILRNPLIVVQEPARTIITYCACWVSLVPRNVYQFIQGFCMNLLGRYKLS